MICFSRNSGPAQVQRGEEEEEGVKWSPRTGTEEGTRRKLILVCLLFQFPWFYAPKIGLGALVQTSHPPSVYHLQFKNSPRTPPVQYLRHTDQSITIFTLRTWNRILHSKNHSYRPPPLTYSPPRHGPGRLEADSLHHLVQCKYWPHQSYLVNVTLTQMKGGQAQRKLYVFLPNESES